MEEQLKKAIAAALAANSVGLFRTQIFDRIGEANRKLCGNSVDRMSATLTQMKNAGHIDRGPVLAGSGSRWSITARGRAAYSALNGDTDETSAQTSNPSNLEVALDRQAELAPLEDQRRAETLPDVLAETLPTIDTEINPGKTRNEAEFSENIEDNYAAGFDTTGRFFHVSLDTVDQAQNAILTLLLHHKSSISVPNKQTAIDVLQSIIDSSLFDSAKKPVISQIKTIIEHLPEAA